MIVFVLGSFQYGSGIISSLLLALSPLNVVESMAIMMFAGAALSALMVWLPPVSGALAKLGLDEYWRRVARTRSGPHVYGARRNVR